MIVYVNNIKKIFLCVYIRPPALHVLVIKRKPFPNIPLYTYHQFGGDDNVRKTYSQDQGSILACGVNIFPY